MSQVYIDGAAGSSLERARRILAAFPGGAESAAKSAVSRAVSHLRAESGKAVRERYDISAGAISDRKNTDVSCSLGGGLTATVSFRGTRIPLHRFGGASPAAPKQDTGRTVPAMISGRWVRVHPGAAASGHQLRSTAPTRFEHAFVARMRSGHVGIFERTGGVTADGGDEIRQLMGSSVPQMIGSEEVSGKLSEAAMRKFDERLEHEISRIINGW